MPDHAWLGYIFRKMSGTDGHLKYYIVVADLNGQLATVCVNTLARYSALPRSTQADQLPVTAGQLDFLVHDSFIDCSRIVEHTKSEVNEHIQRNGGYRCKNLTPEMLQSVIRIVKNSRGIDRIMLRKYQLTHA